VVIRRQKVNRRDQEKGMKNRMGGERKAWDVVKGGGGNKNPASQKTKIAHKKNRKQDSGRSKNVEAKPVMGGDKGEESPVMVGS